MQMLCNTNNEAKNIGTISRNFLILGIMSGEFHSHRTNDSVCG